MRIVGKSPEEITPEDIAFLRENYTSMGGLLPKGFNGGAFFTPTHVARFIVRAVAGLVNGGVDGNIPDGFRVLEPSCGSGVFIEHLPEIAEIAALELDETSAKVTSIIYPHANVIQGDTFAHDRRDYYDLIIGNPPFGETIEADELPDDFATLTKSKGSFRGKSEFAFVELAVKAARPGGYIAMILPKNIAFAGAAQKLRDYLHEHTWHVASIELPGETFAHVGTSVGTHVHVWRKITPNTRKVYVKYHPVGSGDWHRSGFVDESESDTFYYEGQQPVFHAIVNDIGIDKDGKPTQYAIDNDGETQLDELLEAFTDDYLVRENLDPVAPFRDANTLDIRCPPYEEWRNKRKYLAMWNVLTLGRGEDVPPSGVSSLDFEWQDRLVAEYNGGAA